MDIWLVTIGEPLPVFEAACRPLRTGILARLLAEMGHRVTWWTSTFNHFSHKHYATRNGVVEHAGIRYMLLHANGYDRNVSVSRLANHYRLGRGFAELVRNQPRPDIILCSFPTIELSLAAVRYGTRTACPVVLDVRDLWPDVLLTAAPPALRAISRFALTPYYWMSRYALAHCSAISAVSPGYLDWALSMARRTARQHDGVHLLGYEAARVAPENARIELVQMGIPEGKVLAWFVGSFGRSYDLSTVIDAARLLERKGDDRLVFVLSGTGEEEERLRAYARGLGNVVFTGWIDQPKIQALGTLASMGLQAYHARAEQGLGNKLFEYLSFGLPIVSSLEGENGAFLRRYSCGKTYQPGDAASLATVLRTLLDRPEELSDLAANARNAFASGYSADKVYVPLIEKLERLSHETARTTVDQQYCIRET